MTGRGPSPLAPLREHGLSSQAEEALLRAGVREPGDLSGLTRKEAQKIRGIGAKRMEELSRAMEGLGIGFREG